MDETERIVTAARDLLRIEARAVERQEAALDDAFIRLAHRINEGAGAVLVAGVGKSGLVARLFASKLASVGVRAFYFSALDALHGELGTLRPADLVMLLSNSGQTRELLDIALAARGRGASVAAIVGRSPSPLTRLADFTLQARIEREATETRLPTASTTAMLALTDALVVGVAAARGFTAEEFARNHPGGTLGLILGTRVGELMAKAPEAVALVRPEQPIFETLLAMTRHPNGAALVVDAAGCLAGIVTEGDIRRGLTARGKDFLDSETAEWMTRAPRACGPDTLALEALTIMETPTQVYVLPVVDGDGRILGLLRMHDIAGSELDRSLG